jgi:hypothetical protein
MTALSRQRIQRLYKAGMPREWIRSILPPVAGWEMEAVIDARYDAADTQRR